MVELKQISESAASKKNQTAQKKATGARIMLGKVAGKRRMATQQTAATVSDRTAVTPDERHRLIAEAAFLKAERRSFDGGDPIEDWLEAEAEVDSSLIK